MKKIITKEERMQLHNNGTFLEGYFNASNTTKSMKETNLSFLWVIVALIVVLAFYNPSWLTGAMIICCAVYPVFYIIEFRGFLKKKKRQLLKEKHIEINWATITRVDIDNLQISFIEDDALSPKGKPYIVDYIATKNDCRSVVKGERIILVHVYKKGKDIVLPMIPKKEFSLIREREKCGTVNIVGIEHVPHVNAFSLEENEVVFHSNFCTANMTVDAKKYGLDRVGRRGPSVIFVYEWNGEAYDLTPRYLSCLVRHWEYGDILQKKRRKFTVGEPEYFYVLKQGNPFRGSEKRHIK